MKCKVVKIFKFCCAHRLYRYEGKCRNTHGHNYKACISVEGDTIDKIGMVLDFGIIKEKVGKWIDENWDHAILYSMKDNEAAGMINLYPINKGFALDANPTAEVMAEYLLQVSKSMLDCDTYKVTSVQLWETDDSYVEVSC